MSEPQQSFRDRSIERLRGRYLRLMRLLKRNAPPKITANEGALIIGAVIDVCGPQAMAEYALGNGLRRDMRDHGVCAEHPFGEPDRPIVDHDQQICAECAEFDRRHAGLGEDESESDSEETTP